MIGQIVRAIYKFPLADNSIGSVSVGTGGAFIYSGATYKRVILQADPANTDNVWVGPGGSATVGLGVCLQPGERYEFAHAANGMRAIAASGTQSIGFWLAN